MNFPWNCQSKSCGSTVKISLRRRWWKGISQKANPLFAHMNAAILVSPVGKKKKWWSLYMRLDFTHYLHMTINYFSGTFRAIALEDTLQLACHTDFLQKKKRGHLWDCVVWCSMVVLMLMPVLKKILSKMLDWVSASLVPIQYHISYLPQNRTLPLPSSLLFFFFTRQVVHIWNLFLMEADRGHFNLHRTDLSQTGGQTAQRHNKSSQQI